MRITFISQGLGKIEPPKVHGSISIWTYETARLLAAAHSILVVELGEQPFRTRQAEHEGARYIYVPSALNRALNRAHRVTARIWRILLGKTRPNRLPEYASMLYNLGYIIQASWHARWWASNIIHVHNFSQFVYIVRAFNPDARLILHMHCEWLSQHEPRTIARRIQSADSIICCSGHVRRRLLEVFPEVRAKSHVVYNGTNVERFGVRKNEPQTKSDVDGARILFVGRISPEKGVHLLVEAFVKVAAQFPDASLDIVGGAGSLPADFLVGLSCDPLVRKLEEFYGTDYLSEVKGRMPANLRPRVRFHGNVAHQELAEHYQRASMFVLSSLSDAFPLTVVEAMAAGLPVVASAVGGVPEAVVDNETGYLVEPSNATALATAICRLLGDNGTRTRMAREARRRAEKFFSWRAISEEVMRVYSSSGNG